MKTFRFRLRAGRHLPALAIALAAALSAGSASRADAQAAYSIDFHAITSGGSTLRNSCFVLSGSVGQPVPGYSSTSPEAPVSAVYEGFWSAAPVAGADEIFFTGFEDC